MKIAAVVVTYNRLSLLQECIEAIRNQTYLATKILVINNSSTDGTSDWLSKQKDLEVITQANNGGSFGFYTGLKVAYQQLHDWVWIMDDDTIPLPNALQNLTININDITNTTKEQVGYISSKVNWIDGNPHIMNLPDISNFDSKSNTFNRFDHLNLLSIKSSSFVSIMVSKEAIKKVGLPFKEFFIWGDDAEYTLRITQQGFLGLYSLKSIVMHKTAENYSANLYIDNKNNLWKYENGIRNTLFNIKEIHGTKKYFFKVLKTIFVMSYRICKYRKVDKYAFMKMNIMAAINSFSFNPKIDHV